ncbi:MAG: YraN family protein [Candidatus Kerfeldbacteria bacterium]|nr:YraN family protein [Candidatus Kerfeldbacteria bacterium]
MEKRVSAEKRIGAQGEAAALRYLRTKGYVLIAKNVRTRFGELDLVMVDSHELVGIEVKTRRTRLFGTPATGVGKLKVKRLRATLEQFVLDFGWHGPYRLDVVGLFGRGRRFRVEHLRGVG